MKTSELRTKTPDQLETMLKDLHKEAFNMRFQKVSGELEKTHRVNEVRKTIARIRTLLNEEKQGKKVVVKQAEEKPAKKKAKKGE